MNEQCHLKNCPIDCQVTQLCMPCRFAIKNKFSYDGDIIQRRRTLDTGEYLIRQSDKQRYIYIIKSGSLKGGYIDRSGREHVTCFYFSGDSIGIEFLYYGKYLVDILALEPCSICYLNLAKFKELHRDSFELREQLINIFSQNLWHSYSMHGSYNSKELVARFLLNLSSHSVSVGESATELKLSMGRHDIGNFLGLSSETVSRALTQLKLNQLISVNRNLIKLHNIEQLKELMTYSD